MQTFWTLFSHFVQFTLGPFKTLNLLSLSDSPPPLALSITQALAWRTFSNNGGLPVLSHRLPFLLTHLPLVCWESPRYLAASLFFLPPLMSHSHFRAAGFSLPRSQSSCIRCWLDDSRPSNFRGVYWMLGHLLILTLINVGIQNKCGCTSEMTSLSDSFFSSLRWSQVAYKQVYQQKRSQGEAILWSVHLTFWGWWWCWWGDQWFTKLQNSPLSWLLFKTILLESSPSSKASAFVDWRETVKIMAVGLSSS